jgi:hypothetical protein
MNRVVALAFVPLVVACDGPPTARGGIALTGDSAGPAPPSPAASALPGDGGVASDAKPRAIDWAGHARDTHLFVTTQLLTNDGSYRSASAVTTTDEWHDASQVGADAAMLALGDSSFQKTIDATFAFTDRLWDRSTDVGGYFPRSSVDGTNVERQTKFLDDNALSGVTWLDARAASSSLDRQSALLGSARSVANFLMQSGLWDTELGGGFWWNTDRPDKPTQTNGLALQLFLRLAATTGETYYRDWAGSVRGWLEGTMLDASDGLFAWKTGPSGREATKFTYDQAIMIDAYVLLFGQTADRSWLAKASALADAMHAKLWAPQGGYVISTSDPRLSPVFSAWATVALVDLFQVDPKPKWRARAEQNVGTLETRLRDPTDHGFFSASKPDGTDRTQDKQAVDQAWMQHAQAKLAAMATP